MIHLAIICYLIGVIINMGIAMGYEDKEEKSVSIGIALFCILCSWLFFGYFIGAVATDIQKIDKKIK